jgi:hypothetical protein
MTMFESIAALGVAGHFGSVEELIAFVTKVLAPPPSSGEPTEGRRS